MNYSVVIPCAGMGKRMGLGYNKLFYKMDGQKTVIEKTVEIFIEDDRCVQIILVISPKDQKEFEKLFSSSKKVEWCLGGKERQDSVYQGLLRVKSDDVMIHDGARPYLTKACINRLLLTLEQYTACLLMVPAKDTIKIVDEDGFVKETPNRASLMHAQTPQAFKTAIIKEAYSLAKQQQVLGTDDASLVEMLTNVQVKMVEGDYGNIKITTPEDL
ncbi:2-C-methyl-D-erythritol 4-phosphate cytidylyltransferase [Beduini massiliensis]|uniref:2-C-methyl-D-erythritol 4-phosphate cytidylyltransferase n=1 Tax=Beduini massiliensis TaxID=1585974 RepID=UPI00059AAC68|nr:2-C-methyl-D-erythritol 4-phosphate cytidylyltransferase [Beduini massiliensis]